MKKVVVVDLDGCLCSINTFRLWLVYSFLFLFASLHWVKLFKFLRSMLLRLTGVIDRVGMKVEVLRVTEELPEFAVLWFCELLSLFTNRNVLSVMEQYNSPDYQIVLCTAAPFHYAIPYADKYEISRVFASPSVFVESWQENMGEVKLMGLKSFYGEDVVIECVLTDHHDDMPLLLESKRCVLVRPTDTTLAAISNQFEFEIIH